MDRAAVAAIAASDYFFLPRVPFFLILKKLLFYSACVTREIVWREKGMLETVSHCGDSGRGI